MTAGICKSSGVLKSAGYIPRTAIQPAPGNAMTNPPAKNKHLFFHVPRCAMNFIVRCLILCVSSYNYFQFSTQDNGAQCEKKKLSVGFRQIQNFAAVFGERGVQVSLIQIAAGRKGPVSFGNDDVGGCEAFCHDVGKLL